MSTPGSPGDPCPQNDPMCPSMPGAYTGPQAACSAHGCVAVSNCLPNHTWNTMCSCQPNGGVGMTANPATGNAGQGGMQGGGGGAGTGASMNNMPRCGDGILQSGEACEANMPVTADCASLNMGTGMLSCDATTCMYDTSMCSGAGTGTAGTGS